MRAFLSKYVARLAGVIAASATGALIGWGVDISPEAAAGLEEFINELMLGGGLLAYSIVHTWFDHKKDTNNDG